MSDPVKFEVGRTNTQCGISWETKTYCDGDELDIGNGDPVIVYSATTGATSLGTGFTELREIIHATIMALGVRDGETFEVFLPAAHAAFTENDR